MTTQAIHKELQEIKEIVLSQSAKLEKFLTITEIKERTGIAFEYWMDKINSGELKARFFPSDKRKRGGYRVAESEIVKFINSESFNPPNVKSEDKEVYIQDSKNFALTILGRKK